MNQIYWMSVPGIILFYLIPIIFSFKNIIDREALKWRNPKISESTQEILINVGRVIGVGIIIVVTWSSIPYWKDAALLVTNQYKQVEGYPSDIYRQPRSFDENVEVGGKTISFLFSSKIEYGKKYKILYLPNTNTGISHVEIK